MPPKIITSHEFPPIWTAHYDGHEEGDYGFGRTEAEAINDLVENCEAPEGD